MAEIAFRQQQQAFRDGFLARVLISMVLSLIVTPAIQFFFHARVVDRG